MQHIKQEFDSIDQRDPEALRKFFLRYSFLTTNDFVLILKMRNKGIRDLKQQAGFRRKENRNYKNVRSIPIPRHLDVPDNWDTPEWWRANYPRYGQVTLSRATGLSRPAVRSRLKRHGIRFATLRESTRSQNPHCNREWLEEHYIGQEMSIRACARLARVSDRILCGWLNYFGFEIRSHHVCSLMDQNSGV